MQDDIIKPRSLLVAFMDDYHPIKQMCIRDRSQDVHMGGSGCGCSASVLNSEIYRKLRNGTYKKILFIATGALLSLTSSMQGDSVPSIAHAVCISCLLYTSGRLYLQARKGAERE